MAYTPGYDFSAFQGSNPTTPLPGGALDNELAAVATETNSLASKIDDVRRSDGALKNGIVTADSLASSVAAFLDDKQNDAAASATAAAGSAAAAAASAAAAATSASTASGLASAAAGSASAAAASASGVETSVTAAVAAKEAAETAEENAETAATAAASSASNAGAYAATSTTMAGSAGTDALAAAGSAGAAATSASSASDRETQAALYAAEAEGHADNAASSLEGASSAAAAAVAAAANAAAVLDELDGLDLEISVTGKAADLGSADLTVTDDNVMSLANVDQEWTITGSGDVTLEIENGAFTDADPTKRLTIPLFRFGDGDGELIVKFVDGTPEASTTPSPAGNWVIYGNQDADDTAATAGNEMYDGTLPTQTLVGAAGNDRLAVSCLMIQCNQPIQSPRVASCTIDGQTATIAIPVDQEVATDGDPIMAVAVYPLANQASGDDAGHPVIWTTNGGPREGQMILSRVFKDCDLSSPHEGIVRDPAPMAGGTSDGTNYVKSLDLAPGDGDHRYGLVFHISCSGNLTGVSGAGGSESLAPMNSGGTSSRAIAALVRAVADISSTTTCSFRRAIAQSNAKANCVGLLLRPKTVPGSPTGTVITDSNVAAKLTRENQSALLRLYPSGNKAHLAGV